jgi:hypothetical protein
MNEQTNATRRDLDALMRQAKGWPPARTAQAVWEWMRAQGFEQAHTPSDDERSDLANVIRRDFFAVDGLPDDEDYAIADAVLAAGFRRTAVQEPSTDDRPICAACGVPFHLLQHDEGCDVPEPQGEPTDARQAAARAIFEGYVGRAEGFDKPAFSYDREKAEHVADRALRAAGIGQEEKR